MNNKDWLKLKERIGKTADSLENPIDSGILDLVVSLNYLRINTTGSCEGYMGWGCANPWVDIESNKDVSKLIEETSGISQLADDTSNDLNNEKRESLWQKLHQIESETSLPNLKERMKLVKLLDEFYQNHRTLFDTQLHIEDYDFYCSRLESNGASLQDIRSKKEKEEKLKEYQGEMKAFSDFLKEKCEN